MVMISLGSKPEGMPEDMGIIFLNLPEFPTFEEIIERARERLQQAQETGDEETAEDLRKYIRLHRIALTQLN